MVFDHWDILQISSQYLTYVKSIVSHSLHHNIALFQNIFRFHIAILTFFHSVGRQSQFSFLVMSFRTDGCPFGLTADRRPLTASHHSSAPTISRKCHLHFASRHCVMHLIANPRHMMIFRGPSPVDSKSFFLSLQPANNTCIPSSTSFFFLFCLFSLSNCIEKRLVQSWRQNDFRRQHTDALNWILHYAFSLPLLLCLPFFRLTWKPARIEHHFLHFTASLLQYFREPYQYPSLHFYHPLRFLIWSVSSFRLFHERILWSCVWWATHPTLMLQQLQTLCISAQMMYHRFDMTLFVKYYNLCSFRMRCSPISVKRNNSVALVQSYVIDSCRRAPAPASFLHHVLLILQNPGLRRSTSRHVRNIHFDHVDRVVIPINAPRRTPTQLTCRILQSSDSHSKAHICLRTVPFTLSFLRDEPFIMLNVLPVICEEILWRKSWHSALVLFQELCLITPWQGLCDWRARQPWCHRLDSAQRRLCTAGRVISPVACPNHSMFSAFGRWGWAQKQIRESACQFHRIDSASVCTRALTSRAIANELHGFFTSKTAPFVPTTAHGVESPHVSRVHVTG